MIFGVTHRGGHTSYVNSRAYALADVNEATPDPEGGKLERSGGKLNESRFGSFATEASGMPTGTIARLLIDKGFGFIRDEGGIEHFFHRSSVRGAVFELLREGQRVEFTPEDSQKGPRAGDVRLIEG